MLIYKTDRGRQSSECLSTITCFLPSNILEVQSKTCEKRYDGDVCHCVCANTCKDARLLSSSILTWMWPCLFCSCLRIFVYAGTMNRFTKLATWVPYSNSGDPVGASGSPGTTKEAAQGLGPGPWPCPALWARTLAASFVVPGDPEAATEFPVFEYGPKLLILKTIPWWILSKGLLRETT